MAALAVELRVAVALGFASDGQLAFTTDGTGDEQEGGNDFVGH